MEKELVSIIVPAYNAKRYVERCLDSLLEQTYGKIEILVIDDGSTDNTGSICDAYAKKDERIKVLHVENGGVSRARNRGIAAAAGEFIMFVDSDDYVAVDYVEKHYQAICKENADWAISGYYICYPTQQEENRIDKACCGAYGKENFGQIFSRLYQGYFLNSPWNKIYRRALITSEFCTDMALGEDLRFNLDYMENVSRICISRECCYYYMCDEQKDSLTKRISKGNFQSEMKNYHAVMEWCQRLKAADTGKIQQMYVQSVTSMLFSMARKQMLAKEKQEIIKELCQDAQTKEAMRTVKTLSWKSEVLRWLLARGSWWGVFLILAAVRFV